MSLRPVLRLCCSGVTATMQGVPVIGIDSIGANLTNLKSGDGRSFDSPSCKIDWPCRAAPCTDGIGRRAAKTALVSYGPIARLVRPCFRPSWFESFKRLAFELICAMLVCAKPQGAIVVFVDGEHCNTFLSGQHRIVCCTFSVVSPNAIVIGGDP